MRSWIVVLFSFMLFSLVGCQDERELLHPVQDNQDSVSQQTKTIDAGVVIESSRQPTTWNQWSNTEIKTDKGSFVVSGSPYVIKDDKATVKIFDNGDQFFCLESWSACKKLWD